MTPPQADAVLDLRKTKCPLNFVQAKLALEKLAAGQILAVYLLADGESAINVPDSLIKEGHRLLESQPLQEEALPSILVRLQKQQ